MSEKAQSDRVTSSEAVNQADDDAGPPASEQQVESPRAQQVPKANLDVPLAANNASTMRDAAPPQIAISIKANGNQKQKAFQRPSGDSGATSKQPGRKGLVRHVIAVLALTSIVLANMNRQAFNQALVSMTRKPSAKPSEPLPTLDNAPTLAPAHSQPDNFLSSIITTTSTTTTQSSLETTTPFADYDIGTTQIVPDEDDDRFDWTGAQIGTLQAAFSYGYTPFMIPGGRLSELYGAKWVVFLSGFGSALCCALSPIFADYSFELLVASRVFMGLCQTGVSPALYALLTRWLPADESSVYLPMIKVGVMIGFMGGSLISGFFHWRTTFYVVGVIGVLWSVMWAFMASSDPSEHSLISENELEFIQTEIRRANKGRAQSVGEARRKSAPWLAILTNPVVVAFMFTKFTVKLSTDAQSMQIPMYLHGVMHAPQAVNALLSSANFAIQAIFTGLVAYAAKEMIARQAFGLSKTGVRRLFQGICNFGMALAYITLCIDQSSFTTVYFAVIILSVTAMFGAGGEAVLPIDLSLEFSASIMAIANSAANMSGIILPQIVSFVLNDQRGDAERWKMVWYIVGGIISLGGVLFAYRVDAEFQDFDSDKKKKESKNDTENWAKDLTIIEMKNDSVFKARL